MHEEYQQLYRVANNNALDLLAEAKILFGMGRYARAFFLAFTALEEISKSQLAADVVTGFMSEDEFLDHYRCHHKKIGRMAWATEEAHRYLEMDLQHPDISSRANALYASLKDQKVQTPTDAITKEDAQGIIRTALRLVQQTAIRSMLSPGDFRRCSSIFRSTSVHRIWLGVRQLSCRRTDYRVIVRAVP